MGHPTPCDGILQLSGLIRWVHADEDGPHLGGRSGRAVREQGSSSRAATQEPSTQSKSIRSRIASPLSYPVCLPGPRRKALQPCMPSPALPHLGGGKLHDHPLLAARCPDTHPVPSLHPQGHQGCSCSARLSVQIGVREAAALMQAGDSLHIWLAVCEVFEEASNAGLEEGRRRAPFHVALGQGRSFNTWSKRLQAGSPSHS